ncbi:MAG: helix-turn-helix domain-containing protein [Patescibacteria group bacterium]|nr:helix-turn-helix domain-containing protein [Patescibacteria group bacterium]
MLVPGAFRWSKRSEEAALLVAADELSDTAIAARCGVSQMTLERWKRRTEFRTRVEEHVAAWRAEVFARGIADRARRVDALNERWDQMKQVIGERGADPEMAAVPGGTTGLLVKTLKIIGVGKDAQAVEEYTVDTGLLKELREHEKQAAQELGQWTEKREHSGELLVRRYEGVDVDAV